MKRLTEESLKTLGYKIKLYPNKEQVEIFKQYFGASRFVYNLGIHLQEEQNKRHKEGLEEYSLLSYFNLVSKYTKLKKEEKYSWLNNYSSSLSLVFKDVCIAYDKFFKGICKHPKYHKKKFSHQMFPIRPDRLSIYENSVKISSIGIILCDKHNYYEIIGSGNKDKQKTIYHHYYNSRVIFDGCDYWLSLNLELNHEENIEANSCKRFKNNEIWQHKKETEPIGIDLGCKKHNWIVDSKGNRIDRPDTSKEERKVKKYHKKLMHKFKVNEDNFIKGKMTNSTVTNEVKRSKRNYTKNEEKILKKLNKAYNRITNKRKTLIHQYACSIIAEKPSSIVMENLNIKGMIYSKADSDISYIHRERHNKNIYDSMLYTIREIIECKAQSNNIPFILADKEYPSTQLCSKCGYRQKIGIKSIYKCPLCGNEIDRDLNAALNLSYLGYPDFEYNYA